MNLNKGIYVYFAPTIVNNTLDYFFRKVELFISRAVCFEHLISTHTFFNKVAHKANILLPFSTTVQQLAKEKHLRPPCPGNIVKLPNLPLARTLTPPPTRSLWNNLLTYLPHGCKFRHVPRKSRYVSNSGHVEVIVS